MPAIPTQFHKEIRLSAKDAAKVVNGFTSCPEFEAGKALYLSLDLSVSSVHTPFCQQFSENEYYQLVKLLDEMPDDETAIIQITYTGIGVSKTVIMSSGTTLDITDYSTW